MAEKDATTRLRRAVKGQVILVSSFGKCKQALIDLSYRKQPVPHKETPPEDRDDPAPQWFTSLVWAASQSVMVTQHSVITPTIIRCNADALTRICCNSVM